MLFKIAVVAALLGGDWPQFRGPRADAHADGPATPLEWSETQHVVWKTPIAGLGWSSASVARGKVYLTTAVPQGEGLSLRALALDVETGRVIWDREVRAVETAPAIHKKNSHASPTPLVQGDAVFVHFGTLGMARLQADTGAVQWLCTELDYPPVHGSGGTPVLHSGKLVVACDGSSHPYVAAVDAETGKIAWKRERTVTGRVNHSFVTAAVAEVDGQVQVLAPGPDHCAAYDIHTGEELWKVRAPGWSVVPQPTVAHGLVIYNHDYDNPELLAVRLGGKGDITDSHIAWRLKRGAPSTPTPVLVEDDLYFVSDNGIASCVNAKTGEVYWTQRLGDNYSASPVYANGRILFLNENGLATWVKPAREFEVLGTNQVPGRTFATPAFSNGAMYLRTDGALYKIAR
jgi:outer membrane protein assembly factor BamB